MQDKYLIRNFWTLNKSNRFGSNTISLYFYLLELARENKSEKFYISDRLIKEELAIHRNTIKKARSSLINANLIKVIFEKGIGNFYELLVEKPIISENKLPVEKEKKTSKKVLQNPKPEETNNIPPFKEFLDYAKSLPHYSLELDNLIESKYKDWKKKGWKNAQDRPITDFKPALKAILPFLQKELENISIPDIQRPLK